MNNIAFLGMGLMGSRMVSRLIEAHFNVAVWNRNTQKCQPLIDKGATALQIEHIGNYPIIATCLADDHAVQQVIAQILPHLQPNQVIVDFSSLSVDKTKKLAATVAQKNVAWIDAPVSGGIMGAEQGSLVIFAGGDPHIIEDLKPFFAPLSSRITHMGAVGTGQVTKICNQLIVAASAQLISEAVALASAAGVNADMLAPALQGGFADSKPLQILAPRMASNTFIPVQWKCQTLAKDLNNALNLAQSHNVSIPMAAFASMRYTRHIEHGFATQDLSTLIKQFK